MHSVQGSDILAHSLVFIHFHFCFQYGLFVVIHYFYSIHVFPLHDFTMDLSSKFCVVPIT
jgi:hypothetical protein